MINNDYPPFTMINTFSTNTKSQFYHQSPVWLVVLTILKNMKVNGEDYPIYCGKKTTFETTNQLWFETNKHTKSFQDVLVDLPLVRCLCGLRCSRAHIFNGHLQRTFSMPGAPGLIWWKGSLGISHLWVYGDPICEPWSKWCWYIKTLENWVINSSGFYVGVHIPAPWFASGDIFMVCLIVPSGKQPHNYGKSPCYSWVNQLFRLGHVQVR